MVQRQNIITHSIARHSLRRALQLALALASALAVSLLLVPGARANCDAATSAANCALSPTNAQQHRKVDLPPQLPEVPMTPIAIPETLVPNTYARVITPDIPVYSDPSDPDNGIEPVRILGIGQGVGFIYVSVEKLVNHNGVDWYRINWLEYVQAEHLRLVTASGFGGVHLNAPLERPMAFMVRDFQPRLTPGGEINQDAPKLWRYNIVQVFATQELNGWNWYLVGPDQWVEQRNVGVVQTKPKPDGVEDNRWIEIDLYEQTLAVYEDGQIVFATLVSSGMADWYTRPGVFQIYVKLNTDRMSGAYDADRNDYYYLEQVPWTMYFDGAIALHGTYWHNGFGFKKSHGCVNLSPTDAQWLFDWAEEGTYVWVHDPSGQTPST